MNPRLRSFVVLFILAAAWCVFRPTGVGSQAGAWRRLTTTSPESLNLNPSLSGDGRHFAFETTAAMGASNSPGFQLIGADISGDARSFRQLAASRAPAPAISQDGGRIAFSGTGDPLGGNFDGNAEIFFLDGSSLSQITATVPDEPARRSVQGSFQPSISDDGTLIAFSSNRNLDGNNTDGNSEIFLSDTRTRQVTQLTNSRGIAGATGAKISGDGSHVAYLLDRDEMGVGLDTRRDVVLLDLSNRTLRVVSEGASGAAFTYGRAISDDGRRIVFAATTATNSTQVFLYDGRNDLLRRITSLGSRAADVPLHPTISGDGSRIAFATRRRVTNANSDSSVELYMYDVPTDTFTRITDAPSEATAEVIASLSDDGGALVFNFPRVLSESSAPEEFVNNSEIYLATLTARPPFSTDLQILHAAALNKLPATANSLAPDSIAIAKGANLSHVSAEATRSADNSFPQTLRGTTVTVNGRAAQIFYVSPTQINFHVPFETEAGTAEVSVRNPDGFESRAQINVLPSVPGIFTQGASGAGEAIALESSTLRRAPFAALDVSGDPTRLTIFTTGVRHASDVTVRIDGLPVKIETITVSPDLPGLDQIHVALSSRLRGAGVVTVVVRAGTVESNPATLHISSGGGLPRPQSIQLSPATATIPVGGTMRFTAVILDANDDVIEGAAVSFASGDESLAKIDDGGLVEGLREGALTITAVAGQLTATAQLNVTGQTLVINELLADPPAGQEGDANHDGTRSGTDDEFIELANATTAPLDISGWSLKTRALSSTVENTRHLFGAGATIPPGDALVVFGGGSFDADHPAFGGAQVLKASRGGLSLTNNGLTVLVRDASGNLVTQFSYGADGRDDADLLNQSVTRSPDITGLFTGHTAATAGAKRFSPGTKLDGSFFAPRTGRLTRVELQPLASIIFNGQTTHFDARAFDHFGRAMTGVEINFHSSDTNTATIERIALDPSAGFTTATLKGHNPGRTLVSAHATVGAAIVSSAPAALDVLPAPPRVSRIEVAPVVASINRGGRRQFQATAFDENNQSVAGESIRWSSSDEAIATISESGLATGVGFGVCILMATTSDGRGGTVSAQATLNVQLPLVFNEILADVPADNESTARVEGDANRDGVRSSSADEFIEIVNTSNEPVDISGVVLSDSTSTRFIFPAHTTLAAGCAALVFGGGPTDHADPAFGGALIFDAAALGLNDTGDTVALKLPVSGALNTLAALAYGAGQTTLAPSNQSLTRAPDAASGQAGGDFFAHSDAHVNAQGRIFSPGTRADGTPFNSPPLTRIEISPSSVALDIGASQVFTARAFGTVGDAESEIPNVSFIWDSSDTSRATLSLDTGASANAHAGADGTVTIRARAGGSSASAELTVNPPPPILTRIQISPASSSILSGATVRFSAQAFDQFERPVAFTSISFASNNTESATVLSVHSDPLQGSAVADVKGRDAGTAQITVTATADSHTVSSAATLSVSAQSPPIPTPGQIVINEALISFSSSSTQARNDFVELFNTTNQLLDISGLVVTFRTAGAGNAPVSVALPGTNGSATTLIQPRAYFLIVNGASTFGVAADFDTAPVNFDLNGTTGGIKIEIGGATLDGLTYQGSATPVAAPFNSFGEGSIFTFTSGATNDLIRSPDATDTHSNASDFRRNGATAGVTPKAANPTPP